jgi:hypothetical protein
VHRGREEEEALEWRLDFDLDLGLDAVHDPRLDALHRIGWHAHRGVCLDVVIAPRTC